MSFVSVLSYCCQEETARKNETKKRRREEGKNVYIDRRTHNNIKVSANLKLRLDILSIG